MHRGVGNRSRSEIGDEADGQGVGVSGDLEGVDVAGSVHLVVVLHSLDEPIDLDRVQEGGGVDVLRVIVGLLPEDGVKSRSAVVSARVDDLAAIDTSPIGLHTCITRN